MMWLPYIPFSDSLKKGIIRYLLQRYLGQFLEEKIRLDQLTVDLYNGTGSVADVFFDVQALNDLGDQHNLPFEFVDGYTSKISVSIPWASLFKDSSYVEVSGMTIVVQPKQRPDSGGSMLESMWSSISSTAELAAECIKQNPPEEKDSPMEGVETFVQTLDSILSRVKVKFVNSSIRLEHLPKGSTTGIALEVKITHMDYCDEAEILNSKSSEPNTSSAFSFNKFHIEGVSFYCVEFPAQARTVCRFLSDENKDSCSSDERLTNASKSIIIAKLGGRQEIRLKLKNGENIQGPKVDLEMNLGSLSVFLSPRQFHLLEELRHGMATPHIQDNSNVVRCTQKAMEAGDFDRVEQQLMSHLEPVSNKGLHTLQGWSTAALDDSDEEFLPVRGVDNSLVESMSSEADSVNMSSSSFSINSKPTSTDSTTLFNVRHDQKEKKRSAANNITDTGIEECHMQIRLNSLAVVLLHEDILVVSPETGQLTSSSMLQMDQIAEEFFHHVGNLAISGYGKKDSEFAKKKFQEACRMNHIRLFASPVFLESDEKHLTSSTVVNAVLTATCVEILECLVDPASTISPNFIELLKFDSRQTYKNPSEAIPAQTDIRIQAKRVIKRSHSKMSMQRQLSDTDILIFFQSCCLEVDFSLVDRISTIINCQSLCSQSNVLPGKVDLYRICQPLDLPTPTDNQTHIKLSSPHLTVKLRFPIPDLRPLYDMDRPPWWKRNVHKDVLYLLFDQVTLKQNTKPDEDSRIYEILCRAVNLLFQEGESNVQIPIAYAEAGNNINQGNSDYIRFVLNVKSMLQQSGLNEEYLPEMPSTATLQSSFYIETKCDPSPFSTKRVIHKSDTSHESSQCDGDELVIPADRGEMERFINTTSNNSNIIIDMKIPKVNVHLPSKHLYEVLYNRLNTDLSLWKPSRHMAYGSSNDSSQPSMSAFSMCKSPIHCDSDSESGDEQDVFYSLWDLKPNRLKKPSNERYLRGNLAVSVTVGTGSICLLTDDKIPGSSSKQHGVVLIKLKEAFLFTGSSIQGIPHNNAMCAQINNFSLSHICHIGDEDYNFDLKSFLSVENSILDPVLYKIEKGAVINIGPLTGGTGCDNSMDMFTLALSSHVDSSRMKMIRVACGVRDTTLRHKVTYTHQSWLIQLLDFFDVIDYPVPGYQPSQVITELHQHFWNCAVDYRPVNLPMRCLLSVGSLSVSSNMAAHTSSSTLYFIAEDAYFFISDKLSPSVELRLDYVCIIDLGLFELSLRMSDHPRVDLRASNNAVHIRTCSDSAQLLAQLIVYLASYGDLDELKPSQDTSAGSVSVDSTASSTVVLTDSTVQTVNTLMEDAMIDELRDGTKTNDVGSQKDPGIELFCFPDETFHQLKKTYQCQIEDIDMNSLAVDLSEVVREEYVIVEHEAGSGVLRASSLPEVRLLTLAPIGLRENHFSKPTGETDFLKAPLNFPIPVYKYTLREMTLVWFMYGGLDFTNEPLKKQVTIYSESGSTPTSPANKRSTNIDVNYSKTCPHQVDFHRQSSTNQCFDHAGYKKKLNQCWWTRGGIGRQHDVLMELHLNKVRFQHEIYPDKTVHASRQVLLIQEFDIRDRLAISKINKFLYHYTSEAMPKQSHANMLVVKATHLRPDHLILRQECCLRVSLMPLRLNIDQDALLFLITFANELAGIQRKEEVELLVPGSPKHLPPVMGIGARDNLPSLTPQTQVLFNLNDAQNDGESKMLNSLSGDSSSTVPVFFRRFEFSPDVPIRLDYEGKHVDLKHGPFAGLLMGLAKLNCSELRLKRLSHRHGILGFEKLIAFTISEWINDIKKNQLPSLLGGVGPMYSVVQLFQGIRDLFWLPIEQYQKDGRIVRGLQRGANSFTTLTALAALELTTRIVHAIQSVAETAFDMVSPGPSLRRRKNKHGHRSRSRYTPPADFREGITNAVALVKEGIGETAQTLFQEALAEHEDKGTFGAVGGVLRQIPPAMVTPIILASAATSNLLGGVRNQLVPDAHREDALKWRDNDNSK